MNIIEVLTEGCDKACEGPAVFCCPRLVLFALAVAFLLGLLGIIIAVWRSKKENKK